MSSEIERKFLVEGDGWRDGAQASPVRQGYLALTRQRTVRVRVKGAQAFLTIKGPQSGQARAEYEYEIPVSDADEMLEALCERPLIEKTRYALEFAGREWVVDVFAGDNDGLLVAEVELDQEGQDVDLPPWLGPEVTDDPRYLNANLIRRPFRSW